MKTKVAGIGALSFCPIVTMVHLLVGVSISEEQSWRQMARCLVDLPLGGDFDDGQDQSPQRRESQWLTVNRFSL